MIPILTPALILLAFLSATPAQDPAPRPSPADLNKQFNADKADLDVFLKRWESDDRDIFVRRADIVRAAALRPGMAVADVGAGTGLFTWPFAAAVGPKGKVHAVDVAPLFLRYLRAETARRNLADVVRVVEGRADTTTLPPASIDVAFLCATYHHLEKPGPMLASLHQALRPGGRLIVIDFDLRPDSPDFVKQRARAPRDVYAREIEAAGFEALPPATNPPDPAIKDNFYAAFRRRDKK